jgi:hypothetical protein
MTRQMPYEPLPASVLFGLWVGFATSFHAGRKRLSRSSKTFWPRRESPPASSQTHVGAKMIQSRLPSESSPDPRRSAECSISAASSFVVKMSGSLLRKSKSPRSRKCLAASRRASGSARRACVASIERAFIYGVRGASALAEQFRWLTDREVCVQPYSQRCCGNITRQSTHGCGFTLLCRRWGTKRWVLHGTGG